MLSWSGGCGPDGGVSQPDLGLLDAGGVDTPSDSPDATDPLPLGWSFPLLDWPAALLSVHGRADDDVWVVGAPHGGAATALHWDGRT